MTDLRQSGKTIDLCLRESFNKILHAYTLNLERAEGPSFTSGYLLPQVHLYGEFRGAEWKATINVYAWAEAVHAIS